MKPTSGLMYQPQNASCDDTAELAVACLVLMKSTDIAMIVADHGVDPTTPSTDHSRKYVPLLVFGEKVRSANLGIRKTYGDVAATLAEIFSLEPFQEGTSFLREIINSKPDIV